MSTTGAYHVKNLEAGIYEATLVLTGSGSATAPTVTVPCRLVSGVTQDPINASGTQLVIRFNRSDYKVPRANILSVSAQQVCTTTVAPAALIGPGTVWLDPNTTDGIILGWGLASYLAATEKLVITIRYRYGSSGVKGFVDT